MPFTGDPAESIAREEARVARLGKRAQVGPRRLREAPDKVLGVPEPRILWRESQRTRSSHLHKPSTAPAPSAWPARSR